MCVHVPHACRNPWEVRRETGSLGTGVLRGCEQPSWGCQEQSPGPLEAANSLTAVPGASLLLAQESEPQESWLICLCSVWVPGLTASESWTSRAALDIEKSVHLQMSASRPAHEDTTQQDCLGGNKEGAKSLQGLCIRCVCRAPAAQGQVFWDHRNA